MEAGDLIRLADYESFASVNYSEDFAHYFASNVFQVLCLAMNQYNPVPNLKETYHAMCRNLYGITIKAVSGEMAYRFSLRDYSMIENIGISVPTHRSGQPCLSVTANDKCLSVVMMRISNVVHSNDVKLQFLRYDHGALIRIPI
jgi:hypothetical protein